MLQPPEPTYPGPAFVIYTLTETVLFIGISHRKSPNMVLIIVWLWPVLVSLPPPGTKANQNSPLGNMQMSLHWDQALMVYCRKRALKLIAEMMVWLFAGSGP